jgi:hypothetical protein
MTKGVGTDGITFWSCASCSKNFKLKHHLKNHIEALHLHMEYRCSVGSCSKVCFSQPALRMHIRSHEKAGVFF